MVFCSYALPAIYEQLKALDLKNGVENIAENMRLCYRKLIEMELVGKDEAELLEAWLYDLKNID